MNRSTLRSLAFAVGAALWVSGAALAADKPPAAAEPTAAQRQQMAAVHRKMADCLASERPLTECRAEMHQGCVAAMGPQGCPMMGGKMGGMMGGGGMMQGHGMMGGPKPPAPAQP